jgi:hypothetical protein
MSSFLGFKNSDKKLKPSDAYVAALACVCCSDQAFMAENNWAGDVTLLPALKERLKPYLLGLGHEDTDELVDKGLSWLVETFTENGNGGALKPIANSLSAEQKLATLVNVCDLILADGVVDETEERVFINFRNAFDISEQDFEAHLESIKIKNNLSIF